MARSDRARPRAVPRRRGGAGAAKTTRRTGSDPSAKSRPAAAPRTSAVSERLPEDRTEAGRRLSGRALLLGLATLVIVLMSAPTVNTYLKQEREILGLKREIAQEEERIAQLHEEKDRWEDPEYVMQRAREDQFYVLPEEQAYVVVQPRDSEEGGQEAGTGTVAMPREEAGGAPTRTSSRSWPEELLNSILEAGTQPQTQQGSDSGTPGAGTGSDPAEEEE